MSQKPTVLDQHRLIEGVWVLGERDADLADIVARLGPPPLWARQPGFSTLVYIILEQQVSLASARAAYDRLLGVASPMTPERFLKLDDAALKAIGFSRQKARYGRELARAILEERLDLADFDGMSDDAVRSTLMAMKGIGPWTADIYLLMALCRPDIWPSHDLALAVAVQEVKGLALRPTPEELDGIAEPWRPWRAVAARLFWHHYLSDGSKPG